MNISCFLIKLLFQAKLTKPSNNLFQPFIPVELKLENRVNLEKIRIEAFYITLET